MTSSRAGPCAQRATDPIEITTPSDIVHKLMPMMQVGLRAISIFNGAAGVARMVGYPVPKVPDAWAQGASESLKLLKQESSVEQFSVVHEEVMGGSEESKSVRGHSLGALLALGPPPLPLVVEQPAEVLAKRNVAVDRTHRSNEIAVAMPAPEATSSVRSGMTPEIYAQQPAVSQQPLRSINVCSNCQCVLM